MAGHHSLNTSRHNKKWYMVKSDKVSAYNRKADQAPKLLHKGELLESDDDCGKHVIIHNLDCPEETYQCQLSDLVQLTNEDVKWLRPVKSLAARYDLVFSRDEVWTKRHGLNKGDAITFHFNDKMISGTFQDKREHTGTKGYLIDVKFDMEHRATHTTSWITLADVYSVVDKIPNRSSQTDVYRGLDSQRSSELYMYMCDEQKNETPHNPSSCKSDEEDLVHFKKNILINNWSATVLSPETYQLVNLLDNKWKYARLSNENQARLFVLSLLTLSEEEFSRIMPKITSRCPLIKEFFCGIDHKNTEPINPVNLNFNKDMCCEKLKANKALLQDYTDFELVLDKLFENGVIPIRQMKDICACIEIKQKVNHLITLFTMADSAKWNIFLMQIQRKIPELFKRVTELDDHNETEINKPTPCLNNAQAVRRKMFTEGLISKEEATIFRNIKTDEELTAHIISTIPSWYEKPSGFTTWLQILYDTENAELAKQYDRHRQVTSGNARNAKEKDESRLSGTNATSQKKAPVTIEHADKECTVGSMVEVEHEGMKTGVIKWIGYINEPNKLLAGLEMDEYTKGKTRPGVLNGYKLFDCQPGKSLFIHLNKCRPDRRFFKPPHVGEPVYGLPDKPDIPDYVPIPSLYTGKRKGIQGHHNSCYLDATLFCMFAFNDAFDFILYPPETKTMSTDQEEIVRHLKEAIVNPLRERKVVRSDKIMEFRKMLDKLGVTQGITELEKDPEEFLLLLLQSGVRAKPFLEFNNNQDTFLFSTTAGKDFVHIPTTQRILNSSFLENNIRLKEEPKCLILQLPRSGKNFKMYDYIYPSPILKFDEVFENANQKCIVCNSVATKSCSDCTLIVTEIDRTSTAFCSACWDKIHIHESKKQHKRKDLEAHPDGVDPKEMELFAVLCINLSHYVAFVKCDTKSDFTWVFFDSMADRIGDEAGYNVPEVRECTEIAKWLQGDGYAKLVATENLDHDLQRFFGDPYLCFYRPVSNT